MSVVGARGNGDRFPLISAPLVFRPGRENAGLRPSKLAQAIQ